MTPAPLVGVSGIARRLGVTRQRAHVLVGKATRGRGDFPKPVHDLPTGRLWRETDVERWITAHPQYDHTAELERCPTCGQVTA